MMATSDLVIRVSCYAGYRGEEEPRRLHLGERRVEVVEVLDRWLAPDHRYFKVLGDDSAIYIVRHDTVSQIWELTLFDSACDEGRQSHQHSAGIRQGRGDPPRH